MKAASNTVALPLFPRATFRRLFWSLLGWPACRSDDFSCDPSYRSCISIRASNFFEWDVGEVFGCPFISPLNLGVTPTPPLVWQVLSSTASPPHLFDYLVHPCADPILALLQKTIPM